MPDNTVVGMETIRMNSHSTCLDCLQKQDAVRTPDEIGAAETEAPLLTLLIKVIS